MAIPAGPAGLYDPIFYSLTGGGKRLRPTLLLETCKAFGGDVHSALPAAAAIELFHTFTLLHDDIMDNAPMRRGQESVYKRWGVNTAILSGDVMMILAYTELARCPGERLGALLEAFNTIAREVCEGQQMDMEFEQSDSVSIERYIEMINLKTASLIAGSVKMGAILGGASEKELTMIEAFGRELGIAFQLQDDWLDTYGNAEILGKQTGGDIAEGKKTFLLIHALNLSSPVERRELELALGDAGMDARARFEKVKAAYDKLGIRQMTIDAVSERLDAATRALEGLSIGSAALEPLRAVVRSLTNRNK